MKKLLILILLYALCSVPSASFGWIHIQSFVPPSGGAPFTYIQSAGPIDGLNTISLDGVTAGNLIVLFAKWENSKSNISATDGTTALTIGTRADSASADGVMSQFAYLLSANAGDKTYTVTFPGGATVKGLIIFEFSYGGTALLDVQNIGNGLSDAALTGNITTTGTNEVVFGGTGGWSSLMYPTSSEQINDGAATAVIRGGSAPGDLDIPAYAAWYKIFAAIITNAHAQCSFTGAGSEWATNIISFKAV